MANHLASESSPYLLQHKDNPVEWWPWGDEALVRARELELPLLVSIGYSACHWCHVMAHESFEDPDIAELMNARFVCVKVDREEHPDVDAMCMEACQAMTGHGGWPLNTFLTPELAPFYAGTYFPPESRHGLPSWRMVVLALADAWENRRDEIRRQGPEMIRRLGATAGLQPSLEPITDSALTDAVTLVRESHDPRYGGFGAAPKFPQADVIELLLARGQTEIALGTLEAMAAGGIYDQIGGGFARYSVDAQWRVPHFEKMLYDNALLARAYLHGCSRSAVQAPAEKRDRRMEPRRPGRSILPSSFLRRDVAPLERRDSVLAKAFALALDVKDIAMARRVVPGGFLSGAQALPGIGNRVVRLQPLPAGIKEMHAPGVGVTMFHYRQEITVSRCGASTPASTGIAPWKISSCRPTRMPDRSWSRLTTLGSRVANWSTRMNGADTDGHAQQVTQELHDAAIRLRQISGNPTITWRSHVLVPVNSNSTWPVRLRGTENRHKAIQKSRAEVRNSQTNLSYAKSAGMRKS